MTDSPALFLGPGEMARRTTALDWSRAPIGTLDRWPSSLRAALSVCFASPLPMQLWWGPDLTCFYNDACIPSIDHPSALGRSAREVWPNLWPVVGHIAEGALAGALDVINGDVIASFDWPLAGRATSPTFRLSSIPDGDGSIGGLLWAAVPPGIRTRRRDAASSRGNGAESGSRLERARSLHLTRARASLASESHARRGADAKVRDLFARLELAEERERRRMARDIHDNVGQHLTALRLGVEALKSRLVGEPALNALAGRLEDLAQELDESIDFVTWDLRPAALESRGLPAALENLVRGFAERFGIDASFDGQSPGPQLSKEAERHLYRILQEALHNIVKHAEATRVDVTLREQDGACVLAIRDNGRGFHVDDLTSERVDERLGLVSMRERALLSGGELVITSEPRLGTTVMVRVPVGTAARERGL